jgi:3-phosphoshikimate 1-carboxyvinyltransferase
LTTLVVRPAARPLSGSVPVPGDTAVALHAVLFGALGQGESYLAGLPRTDAVAALARCLRALGVGIREAAPSDWIVDGVGLRGLRAPDVPLDCGDSVAAASLLAGVLAAQRFASSVTGSGALASADLTSLVAPLRARGAVVVSKDAPRAGSTRVPLAIGPLAEGRELSPLEHTSEVADPRTKAALLLSGLYADGATIFREPSVSADHTERILAALEAPIRATGTVVRVDPAGWSRAWPAFHAKVPGDGAAAAYLVAAAQLVPGSRVTVRRVATNPTCSGFLEIARALGAGLHVESHGEALGEPFADLVAWCAEPRAAAVGGEPLERAGDALPAACAIAAVARGTTRIRVAEEASTTLDATTSVLRAFGVECAAGAGGLAIRGRAAPLAPADVDGAGDPYVAMAACVLALGASGPSRVHDAGAIAARFPKFVATLRALGASIDVEAP